MGGYLTEAVANYFLEKYGKHDISPLKLQKLVYLAHGWHLAYHGKPLVKDEYVEAWRYGPVFPSLYHYFKHRGRMPILELANVIDTDLEIQIPRIPKADRLTRRLLDRIWEVYGDFSGEELSEMTHKQGSPWQKARESAEGRYNANIMDKDIKAYFEKKKNAN